MHVASLTVACITKTESVEKASSAAYPAERGGGRIPSPRRRSGTGLPPYVLYGPPGYGAGYRTGGYSFVWLPVHAFTGSPLPNGSPFLRNGEPSYGNPSWGGGPRPLNLP